MSGAHWGVRRVVAVVFLAMLSACGGGGSAEGGSSSGPDLQVSPGSLVFSAADPSAPTPASQKITVAATGGIVVIGQPTFSGSGIASVSLNFTGTSTAEVTVIPAAPPTLGVGTRTGTVSIPGCSGVPCSNSNLLPGNPKTVSVTYTVAGFTALPASANLTAAEGANSAPVPVGVSHSSGSGSWTTSILYDAGASGWLTVSPPSGGTLPATLNLSGGPIEAGTYTATVTISGAGSSKRIPVTYTVVKALVPSPASLSYTLGSAPAPADLAKVITIGSNLSAGSPAIGWSAAVDVPWLTLSPPSGDTAAQNQLTASIVLGQAASLLNGNYTGTITLSSGAAHVTPVTVLVSLTIDRPQVNYVTPYVAATNTSKEVVIRGKRFSEVTIQHVAFGNSNDVGFNVVSDTEIRATHPGLTPGTYPVNVVSASGSVATRANLVVVDPANTVLQTGSISVDPGAAIRVYDDERRALLVSSGLNVVKHQFTGGSWVSTTVILPFGVALGRGMALSPDGTELIAATQDGRIARLNSSTLSINSTTPALIPGPFTVEMRSIFATNDGNVLVLVDTNNALEAKQLYRYNLLDGSVVKIAGFNVDFFVADSVRAEMSGDGSRVVFSIQQGTNTPDVRIYDAGTGVLSDPVSHATLGTIALNRNGSRILGFRTVYDQAVSPLGDIPFVQDSCSFDVINPRRIPSPDGTRAYVACISGLTFGIYTYDLTAPTVNGFFPSTGSVSLFSQDFAEGLMLTGDGSALLFNTGLLLRVVTPAP